MLFVSHSATIFLRISSLIVAYIFFIVYFNLLPYLACFLFVFNSVVLFSLLDIQCCSAGRIRAGHVLSPVSFQAACLSLVYTLANNSNTHLSYMFVREQCHIRYKRKDKIMHALFYIYFCFIFFYLKKKKPNGAL